MTESEIREVLEDLTEDERNWNKLSKWEQGFVETIKDYWEKYGHLSPGRMDKLEEVAKKVRNGFR